MDIQEMQKKYNLLKTDFWELRQKKGTWVVSHDAIEKIMVAEGITVEDLDIVSSEWNFCRMIVKCKKENKTALSIGEALLNVDEVVKTTFKGSQIQKGNCDNQYIGCMAEKRGIDRCVLKLINAYQYDIFSSAEDLSDKIKGPAEGEKNDSLLPAQKKIIDSHLAVESTLTMEFVGKEFCKSTIDELTCDEARRLIDMLNGEK